MIHLPGRLNVEIHGMSERLLDLLFPTRCVNCRKPGGALCAECFASIRYLRPPFCSRCSHPLPTAKAVCPECRAHPRTITQIRAAAWHEGAMREAIHALKYNRRRDVVVPLANVLAPLVAQFDAPIDFLTSVPLHADRERARGYNQAELLAEQTARAVRSTYVRVLERTRATADQIGLNAHERRKNVQDAFHAIGNSMAGKNIALIDDVCTTGATLDACAAALFANGARGVYGLTVARAR
jgi:ComF family protein